MSEQEPRIDSQGQPEADDSERNFGHLLTGHLPLQNATAFFILANVLDIFWTYILFRYGAIEANPFANYVLIRWGFYGMIWFKLAIVAMVCLAAQVIALKKMHTARALLWGGTLLVGAVVVYSIFLYSSHFRGGAPPAIMG